MIELFLNHWIASSPSISRWINYIRILTCSSLMLQLLKTTCCLNSCLAIVACIPWNLWHHTQSVIKSLVALCLSFLFSSSGVFSAKRCMRRPSRCYLYQSRDFSLAICGLQCLFLIGYCAIFAEWTVVVFNMCFSAMLGCCFPPLLSSNRSVMGRWGKQTKM